MRLFMLEALVKQQVTKESILTNLQLKKILKDEGVVFAALFGSFVRGEEEEHSDIDLIVRFARYVSTVCRLLLNSFHLLWIQYCISESLPFFHFSGAPPLWEFFPCFLHHHISFSENIS